MEVPITPICNPALRRSTILLALTAALVGAISPALAEIDTNKTVYALAQARLAEDSGSPAEALAALSVVASLSPDLPGLHGRILEQAIGAGDLPAARSAAMQLWNRGGKRLDARLVLMTDAIRRSDWKAARDYMGAHDSKIGPDAASRLITPMLLGWAGVAGREKCPENSILDLERLKTEPVYLLDAALMQIVSRRPDDAEALIKTVTLSDRNSQIVALRLAATFDKQGRGDAAQALRSRIAIVSGDNDDPAAMLPQQPVTTAQSGVAQWFGMLGDEFARMPNGSKKIALLFARVGFWLDPDAWQTRAALAEALDQNSLSDQAIALLGASRTDLPPILAVRQAELLAGKGDMKAAISLAQSAVAAEDASRGVLLRYADLVRRSGDSPVAMAAFDRLLGRLGDSDADQALRAALLMAKANLLLEQDDWDAASPLLEQAVALRPADAATLNFVGYSALERRRNVDQSLARIEAAWQQDPKNPEITDSLGWAYYLTGKTESAVAMLEQAQRGAPNNAVIVEHLGDAYWSAGQKYDARYVWRAAAVLAEPDMAERLTAKIRDGLTPATGAP